jgi:6-pyruvoyltetrahydropterin/6-carboxytetrahydropterin synthase
MLYITKEYTFDAAHFLTKVPSEHPCSRLHGHTYTLAINVAGETNEQGFIIDYHEIDKIVKPIVAELDHNCLNNIIDNPTSENIVLYLRDRVLPLLPIYSLTIKETSKTTATWVKE